MNLFVYGTLKGMNDLECLDEGKHKLPFQMYNLGAYPALVPSKESHLIYGEIYKINEDLLASFDKYEGYPRLYDREKFDVSGYLCWIYFMHEDHFLDIFGSRERQPRLVEDGYWPVV